MLAQSNSAGVFKGTFITRDEHGNPKFDDPHNVPQKILDALTEDDKLYLEALKKATA